MRREQVSLAEARRIALAAQGFDRPRPARVNAGHVRRVIHKLGLLQIDYVNVLAPAHFLVLFSRLGQYRRGILDDLMFHRKEFVEEWAHVASIVPVETWPLLRDRREARPQYPRDFQAFFEANPGYLDAVLDQITAEGAITAEEAIFPDGHSRRIDHTWYRSLPRVGLEAHFARGRLAIAGRLPNFARSYDLAERIVAAEFHNLVMTREEQHRALVRQASRACGIATLADLADYYRMLLRDVRERVAELVESGELVPVKVEGWKTPAYLYAQAALPRRIEAASMLAPFDPVVWFRPRALRLFEFDYRLEIFEPAHKRKWGYYVMPFLFQDRLVARLDLKADRAGSRLLVLAAYREGHTDASEFAEALALELRRMADWLELEKVSVGRKGDLAGALGKIFKTVSRSGRS